MNAPGVPMLVVCDDVLNKMAVEGGTRASPVDGVANGGMLMNHSDEKRFRPSESTSI